MKTSKLLLPFALLALGHSVQARCQLIELPPHGSTSAGSGFGYSVATDGLTALVGCPDDDDPSGQDHGSVQVYRRVGTSWTHPVRLQIPGTPGTQPYRFGHSVDVSGATAIVGAPWDDQAGLKAGAVYVLDRVKVGGKPTWVVGERLVPSILTQGQEFGTSVAIDGDRVVVGAPKLGNGTVHVFDRSGTSWSETTTFLFPPFTSTTFARHGYSVDVDGDTILAGVPYSQVPAGIPGYYHYGGVIRYTPSSQNPKTWNSAHYIFPFATGTGNGRAVAVSGSYVLVGDLWGGSSPCAGQGVARLLGGTTLSGSCLPSRFGTSVAADSYPTRFMVGEPDDAIAGRIRVFDAQGVLMNTINAPDPSCGVNCDFGAHVAMGGGYGITSSELLERAWVFDVDAVWETYCTAGSSATGCAPSISGSGTPSASNPSGFVLTASTVEGAKDGLFFFGGNGRQANPWGNGTSYQCVVPPVARAGLLSGTGTTGSCNGSFSQDLNALWCASCPKPLKNPGAGAIVQAQLWYRDPFNTSNQTTSLSDAIEFFVSP